jgi:hypothetical protein
MSEQRVTPTLLLAIAALLAGAGIFYHYMVTVPQRERAKQALEQKRLEAEETRETEHLQQEQREKEVAMKILDACLQECVNTFLVDWNRACQAMGRSPDCSLPKARCEVIEEHGRQVGRECLKRSQYGESSVGHSE